MKRFQFRLEGLLRLRRSQEEEQIRVLRECNRELHRLDASLDALAAERAEEIEKLRNLESGQVAMERVLAHRSYLNTLNRRGVERAAERTRIIASIQEAQRKVEKAAREREIVERLRERRYREHQDDLRRAEQKELDEVGRNLHAARTKVTAAR